MKYIYKHGNQYWYQRAVPNKLSSLLGKKTLKISLKTNKILTAIKRAKLQALEHKKMFKDVDKNSIKLIKKFFGKNNYDTNNYTLNFIDDYDDLVNKLLFSKSDIVNFLKDKTLNDFKYKSLEKILLEDNSNNIPYFSTAIEEHFQQKNKFNDTKKLYSIRKSVLILIEICGDKALDNYNSQDAECFKKHFIESKKISTGKRNQSNIQNIFSTLFNKYSIDKKNPFSGLKWPSYIKTITRENFSIQELSKIKTFCLNDKSIIGLISGIMFDTGCSFGEIVGLESEDVSLDKYNPYIVIRSNSHREIKNIYKKRIIPLVGVSLKTIYRINKGSNKELIFKNFLKGKNFQLIQLEKQINNRLKCLSEGKTSISFRYSLIERLKLVNCPESIICDLIGVAKKELFYSNVITLDIKTSWLNQIII